MHPTKDRDKLTSPPSSMFHLMRKASAFSGKSKDGLIQTPKERTAILDILASTTESSEDAALAFMPEPLSPYAYPLNGDTYSEEQIGPDGLCPLCNNKKAREYNEELVKTLESQEGWEKLPFTRSQILRHIALHLSLIYAHVYSELVGALDAETRAELERILVSTPKGRLVAGTFRSIVSNAGRYAGVDEYNPRVQFIGGLQDESADAIEPSPSPVQQRTQGEALKWYAFNGSQKLGPLRRWGDKRVGQEMVKRVQEAVVFYDEMLDVRAKAQDIYSRIMDKEGEPIVSKDGELIGYKERNYGAAIQAVRLQKDVAMDLAKMAIIATRLGDEVEGTKRLSPVLQDMLSDMGIKKKDVEEISEVAESEVLDE